MDNEKKKESKKSSIVTAAFFAFSLIVVAVIAIVEFGGKRDRNIENIQFNILFLLAAIGCLVVAVVCETLKYAALLKAKGHKYPYSLGFSCAVIGKYYDNLTPAGAGGQGFQMYHLKKNGCDNGTAGSLPIIGFLGLQFSFVVIGIVALAVGYRFISDDLLAIKITAIVGLVFYAFIPFCIIIFAVAPKLLIGIVSWFTRLLSKIRIVKNAEAATEKAAQSLGSYSEALREFAHQRGQIVKVFILSLIYQLAFMCMPFFVLHMFGSKIGFIECFFSVVFIYAAITIVFTPGNSGAAEASFYMVFASLEGGAAFWGMMIWRALCYYAWIVLGAIVQLSERLVKREREAWKTLPCESGSVGLYVDTFYPNSDSAGMTVNAYATNIPGSYVVAPGKYNVNLPLRNYDIAWIKTLGEKVFKHGITSAFLSRSAKKFIKSHRVELLHAHSPFGVGWLAIHYGKRYEIPVVATYHGKYYDYFLRTTHSQTISKLLIRNVVLPFYNKADSVWACNRFAADSLRQCGYTGEIEIVENGTAMSVPQGSEQIRSYIREQLGITDNTVVLLYMGRLIWRKNIKLVLDTCQSLKDRGYDYKLIVAGDGADSPSIKDYCGDLEINDNVRFIGRVNQLEDIKKVYLISDLLFFPSRNDNALISIRDAAALGVPALVVDGANGSEYITDCDNGFIGPDDCVGMADKIVDIFANDMSVKAGRRAMETIPVSWSDICRHVSDKYKEVVEKYQKI